MSYINWGNETSEQLALRARLEQEALFEQAVRLSQARNQSMTGGAAGGGKVDPLAGLYGVAIDGLIYSLDQTEANWPYNYDPFPSFPSFVCIAFNKDDGYLYAIGEGLGNYYFVRIDRETREFTFIDNNIGDFATKGASSLYYEGDGNFIMLDNFFKSSVSSIVRISLGESFATATEVSEVDSEDAGITLRNLFLYDGAPWAIAYLSGGIVIGPLDIETGSFGYFNQLLPSPEDSNISSIEYVFNTVENRGSLYMVALWEDTEENLEFGLFKIDTEYGGIAAPYYVKYISDGLVTSVSEDYPGDEIPVLSLFQF